MANDLVGKTAVWKIRVHGPEKFAQRSGVIAFVSGNSAFTKEGHQLRLCDQVASVDDVVGGGSWAADAPVNLLAAMQERGMV